MSISRTVQAALPQGYLILVKDSFGDDWVLKVNPVFQAIPVDAQPVKDFTGCIQLDDYLIRDKKTLHKRLKVIRDLSPDWWDKALADYEQEAEKNVLKKSTAKVVYVGISYSTTPLARALKELKEDEAARKWRRK